MDAFVALTGATRDNLIVSLLARQAGVQKLSPGGAHQFESLIRPSTWTASSVRA
jgi:hypothetical protein